MTVKIVTDSTSDIPADLSDSLGITVVPLYVHFGTEVFQDGVTLFADQFYDRLVKSKELPKTSQPSVGDFVTVYEDQSDGADGILSIHVSAKLSGTYNSAIQAQEQVNLSCPLEVIDTYQASMALGMIVLNTARAAQDGASLDDLVQLTRDAMKRSQCVCLFDTMEYLIKGGRVGKARGLIGTLLKIRPMIIIQDGEVHELGKERTRTKGIARLRRFAMEFGRLQDIAVMYSTTPDDAYDVARVLSDLLPDGREPLIARFGPVIGTYTGPGALGFGLLGAD